MARVASRAARFGAMRAGADQNALLAARNKRIVLGVVDLLAGEPALLVLAGFVVAVVPAEDTRAIDRRGAGD